MNVENKTRLSLIIWILALIAIGGVIGSLMKPEISAWYSTLNRFTLTPSLNSTFLYSFGRYGYSGLCAHLLSLPKNESGFAADDSIFIMDSVRKLLKFLYMAVQLRNIFICFCGKSKK